MRIACIPFLRGIKICSSLSLSSVMPGCVAILLPSSSLSSFVTRSLCRDPRQRLHVLPSTWRPCYCWLLWLSLGEKSDGRVELPHLLHVPDCLPPESWLISIAVSSPAASRAGMRDRMSGMSWCTCDAVILHVMSHIWNVNHVPPPDRHLIHFHLQRHGVNPALHPAFRIFCYFFCYFYCQPSWGWNWRWKKPGSCLSFLSHVLARCSCNLQRIAAFSCLTSWVVNLYMFFSLFSTPVSWIFPFLFSLLSCLGLRVTGKH